MRFIQSPSVDQRAVLDELRSAFADVAVGSALSAPQAVVDLPGGGDVIHYPGLLATEQIYAVKVSPYLPRAVGPAVVTAWTLLLSSSTGAPIALVNAGELTAQRTGATSALAADALLPSDASVAAVIGYGDVARAHIDYLRLLRPEMTVRVHARSGGTNGAAGVRFTASIAEAVDGADLVMLCTSAAADVIDPRSLRPGTVVTSISTNAPGAREIPAAAVTDLEVYLDASSTTDVAAELIQAQGDGWTAETVRATLPELLAGTAAAPTGERVVYFRSVGLGIEDAAVAWAAYRNHEEQQA